MFFNFNKNLVFTIVLIILLFGVTITSNGCGCGTESANNSEKSNLKTLRVAIPSDITATDPAMSSDVNSGLVLSKVFEKLVTLDENLAPSPDLAETFEVSADCTEFKFKLKSNIKFSDGKTLLTAKMVKNSFERVISPKTISPRANIFEKLTGYDEFIKGTTSEVSGIKISGDYEIILKIKEPFAPFIYNLTMVSASIVTFTEDGGLIGTGPYIMTKKSDGAKLILTKNNFYHDIARVKLDEIIYKIIHDEQTQISEFEVGNIDILNLSTINVNDFIKRNGDKFNVINQPKLNIYYIAFNCQNPLFTNPKIRQAMNYAINKEEIINMLMKNTMISSKGPFPPALGAFDQTLAGYEYNPEKAKKILEEEKVKELKFDLYYKSSYEFENLMQLIKDHLEKVGIKVGLKKMEWAALKAEIVKGNLPAYYLNWSADFPDAHNFLVPVFHTKNKGVGGNRAFYSDPELDKMMDKLETTSNKDDYKKLAQDIQKKVVESAPWLFLWHEIEFAATQKNIDGYKIPKIYSMEKFLDLSIK